MPKPGRHPSNVIPASHNHHNHYWNNTGRKHGQLPGVRMLVTSRQIVALTGHRVVCQEGLVARENDSVIPPLHPPLLFLSPSFPYLPITLSGIKWWISWSKQPKLGNESFADMIFIAVSFAQIYMESRAKSGNFNPWGIMGWPPSH